NGEAINLIQDSLAGLLVEVRKLKTMPFDWIPLAVRDVSSRNAAIWQELHRISKQAIAGITEIAPIADSTKIDLPEDCDPKAALEDALTLKEHLEDGGRLGWGPFRPKPVKSAAYIIKNIRVNSRLCDNL